jgi:plastocyanin
MKLTTIVVAIYICAVYPLMSKAETHDVSIKNSAFIPNDLVIQAGDTVVWTYAPQERDCPYGCPSAVLHNVTADDQSFSSGPPADEWTYQQTFVQAGEILYHCEVHSEPGRDINSFMNGRITVQGEADAAFQINPGLNDAWFNLATNGQGFLITVFPDIKEMFVAWFTFDTVRPAENVTAFLGEPGHRWLTAQGSYEGDTANLTIYVTKGGVFDSAEPAASADLDGDGTMTLEFADCENGLVNYEITSLGISGEIPIQRIVLDNVPLCESLEEQLLQK